MQFVAVFCFIYCEVV